MIGIVTPAPPRSRHGNRVTALRWARILRSLGHRVTIAQNYEGESYDFLIALHALRSHDAINRWRREHPDRPLLVALTGTDLYRDLPKSKRAQQSLELATRLIVLQPKAFDDLPNHLHAKTRVIYQSVKPFPQIRNPQSRDPQFPVLRHRPPAGNQRSVPRGYGGSLAARVIAHPNHPRGRRDERKDGRTRPSRDARSIHVTLDRRAAAMARPTNPDAQPIVSQFLPPGRRGKRVSEAIVAGAPVIASRIAGNVGLLGEDYAGYFHFSDTRGLARLLARAESDSEFLAELKSHCGGRAHLFSPERERAAWREVITEYI